MSTKYTNIENFYFRNNQIRMKLLLLIDNEIQSKIKQSNQKLKFKYEDGNLFKINFEETFIQKRINKYDFPSSKILKTKKNNYSDKSFSIIDGSSNKINEKQQQKKRANNDNRTLSKKSNHQNKILSDNIFFHKKIYSIKNLSKQSSTFLILPKQKKGVEYLKALCNNIKICKNCKKITKHVRSKNNNIKILELSNDKKAAKKLNEINVQKSKEDNNLHTFSLFRKSKKRNFLNYSKSRISGKSTNSIFSAKKQKEK